MQGFALYPFDPPGDVAALRADLRGWLAANQPQGDVVARANCWASFDAGFSRAHGAAGDVGMTGCEPATPSSRTTYATGLRYIPNDLPVPQKYCENIVPANSLLFLRAVFCIFLFKQIFKRIFYRLLCILFCTLQRFF